MSEQSAAWEYKEESPLREAWKMYLQNRAARWIPSRWSLRP